MTAAFVTYTRAKDGKFVAHSLDFDLVAVGDDDTQALKRLRTAVKTYIEYGLSNNWPEDIFFPAPKEYWDRFDQATALQRMDPIGVIDDRMMVVRATITEHAYHAAPCTA